MDILFTELFDRESRDKFGISRETVRKAVKNPLSSEEVSYDGLQLKFYTKKFDNKQLLLVLATKTDDQVTVDLAFKIKEDLTKALKILKPTQILSELIEKYGLTVVIGDTTTKLAVAQDIDIKPEQVNNLLEIKNPDNHSFTTSMFIKINEDKTKAKCALVFALDIDEYLEWVTS